MVHNNEHHSHEHVHQLSSLNKSFIIGITLNILFVLVEFGIGFYYDSLGLLSDAGHNLSLIHILNVEGGDTQKNTFYWKLMHLHTYWADSPTVLGSLQRVSGLIRKLRCVHE